MARKRMALLRIKSVFSLIEHLFTCFVWGSSSLPACLACRSRKEQRGRAKFPINPFKQTFTYYSFILSKPIK